MKALIAAAVIAGASLAAVPAHAVGCASGAVMGGVAGHVAGHHGLLGAAAGCAVGHHEANKQKAQAASQQTAPAPAATTTR